MNVLHVRAGTSIWLVEARDLNPRGISIPVVLAALKARYGFQSQLDLDPSGQRTEIFSLFNGTFTFEDQPCSILSAKAFNDGFVLTSGHSTVHSDATLTDMFSFLAAQFGFAPPAEVPFLKSYLSELVVNLSIDFDALFAPRVRGLRERLSQLAGVTLTPSALAFLTDPEAVRVPTTFRLEREAGKPFSDNRYWSVAPVSTLEHEGILRALETPL